MPRNNGYWTRTTLSRRTALRVAAVGGGAATLSLAGCGGGSSSSGGAKPAATEQATVDPTKGISGGTLKFGSAGFPASFNPIATATTIHTYAGLFHSSLLRSKWGQPSVGLFDYYNFEGNLAQALPEQPDQTTMTFKLKPGVKFHNGQALTSEDVRYSYDRYANYEKSLYRTRYRAWLERVETPDPLTVVIKTKFPYADAVVATAGIRDGYIVSKEHEEGPDTANKFMGTGPWVWGGATPPVSFIAKRNPDFYDKPYPYFDEVQVYGYSDPVKRLTDFVTGQIQIPWLVYAEERDQIKRQRPDAVFQGWDSWAQSLFMRSDKPPFNDKRVRQALSMTIDRKKIREVATKGEGRDDQWFALQYKDVIGSREVKDLGPASKNWELNPAEAKKLLAAAGIDKPIETQHSHYDGSVLGQFFPDIAVASIAGWRELGVANVKDLAMTSPQYNAGPALGNYEGMGQSITSGIDGGGPAFTLAVKDNWYWGPAGEHAPANLSQVNDPRLNALVDKQVQQFKLEDRKATYREMEPIIADEQYKIIYSTTTQNYFWDPKLRNARIPIEQSSRQFMMRWWFDKA